MWHDMYLVVVGSANVGMRSSNSHKQNGFASCSTRPPRCFISSFMCAEWARVKKVSHALPYADHFLRSSNKQSLWGGAREMVCTGNCASLR